MGRCTCSSASCLLLSLLTGTLPMPQTARYLAASHTIPFPSGSAAICGRQDRAFRLWCRQVADYLSPFQHNVLTHFMRLIIDESLCVRLTATMRLDFSSSLIVAQFMYRAIHCEQIYLMQSAQCEDICLKVHAASIPSSTLLQAEERSPPHCRDCSSSISTCQYLRQYGGKFSIRIRSNICFPSRICHLGQYTHRWGQG